MQLEKKMKYFMSDADSRQRPVCMFVKINCRFDNIWNTCGGFKKPGFEDARNAYTRLLKRQNIIGVSIDNKFKAD